MHKTKIKIWMILSAVTLGMLSVTVLSLAQYQAPFYKGTESIAKVASEGTLAGQDSVLTVVPAQTSRDFSDVISENEERLAKAKAPYEETDALRTELIAQSNSVAPKPLCPDSQIPIMRTGTFMGCASEEVALPPTTQTPIPVISGITSTQNTGPAPIVRPLTGCEAEGKQTYRGKDKPGLIYGMCI